MAANKLLVVDDDSNLLEFLQTKLKAADYEVKTAMSGNDAAKFVKDEGFDLCVVDMRLADANGISLMHEFHSIDPHMPVIILTGFASVESAVDAMKKGAFSYLTKPLDARELMVQIDKALENRRLNYEIHRLQGLLEEKYAFPNIVAKSASMKRVLDRVSKIATIESSVYLYVESSTGKEVIAKAIHFASPRRDKPFVAINCAAVPESLLESELFGHEKGSFTGAVKSTRGLFSQANGGTI